MSLRQWAKLHLLVKSQIGKVAYVGKMLTLRGEDEFQKDSSTSFAYYCVLNTWKILLWMWETVHIFIQVWIIFITELLDRSSFQMLQIDNFIIRTWSRKQVGIGQICGQPVLILLFLKMPLWLTFSLNSSLWLKPPPYIHHWGMLLTHGQTGQ